MKIKHLIASLTVIGIMISGTAFAMPDKANNPAQTFESLSSEQITQWTKLHEEHIKKTRPIRSELQAKYMELRALRNNAQVSPDYIRELTQDIVKLKNRTEDANEEFFQKSKEKFNLDFSSMMHGDNGRYCGRRNGDSHQETRNGHKGMMRDHGASQSKGYHSQQHGSNGMEAKTPQSEAKM